MIGEISGRASDRSAARGCEAAIAAAIERGDSSVKATIEADAARRA
jgi:hypothetical protein